MKVTSNASRYLAPGIHARAGETVELDDQAAEYAIRAGWAIKARPQPEPEPGQPATDAPVAAPQEQPAPIKRGRGRPRIHAPTIED